MEKKAFSAKYRPNIDQSLLKWTDLGALQINLRVKPLALTEQNILVIIFTFFTECTTHCSSITLRFPFRNKLWKEVDFLKHKYNRNNNTFI